MGRTIEPRDSKTPELAKLLSFPDFADGSTAAGSILEAATKEFLEYGLRRTAVEDVAKKAGVARVTVYRKFPTKDALVQAVFLRETKRFIADVEGSIPRGGSFEARMIEGFTAAVRLARAQPMVARLLETDPETIIYSLTLGAGPVLAMARAYLADHIRRAHGGKYAARADAAAESVMRLGLSFVLTRGSCVDLEEEKKVREYARRYILPLVTGELDESRPN